MGSVKKAVKKVTKFVDKKVVEPLERPVKSVAKAVDKAIVEPLEKPVKSVVKAVVVKPVTAIGKVADEAFEELIEKPVKKIATETFDVVMGTDKEERRAMLYPDKYPATPATTPEVTPEVTPVEEPTIMEASNRRRTRGKRAGGAGTILEGYGTLYAKASPKAPTGG